MKIPADLAPESITVIIDSREQRPFGLEPMQTQRGTLRTGDYSIAGMTDEVSIERKSLDDLLACIGRERERFEAELKRLQAYPWRLVVVEAGWPAVERGEWRSKVTPTMAMSSVCSWMGRYQVPFHFCGSRELAADATRRFLFLAAKSRYKQARELLGQVKRRESSCK